MKQCSWILDLIFTHCFHNDVTVVLEGLQFPNHTPSDRLSILLTGISSVKHLRDYF